MRLLLTMLALMSAAVGCVCSSGTAEVAGNDMAKSDKSQGIAPNNIVTIVTTSAMRDSEGKPVRDCIQPKIHRFGDRWYAYGFGFGADVRGDIRTSTVYSTQDFVAWTKHNEYVPPEGLSQFFAVLYNNKNGEYVGFAHNSYGGVCRVFTSQSPVGPFKFHSDMRDPAGHGFGDMEVFQDDDGSAYLVYNKYKGRIPERFSYIYQLDDDYYNVLEQTLCDTKQVIEGFWMFKRNDTYYLLGSGLVSYDVDDNFYLTAPSPLGPWTRRGLIAPAGSKTFESQTFRGIQIRGAKGNVYVFIGLRWNALRPGPGGFPNACHIWLPLAFNADGTIQEMKWQDSWYLDTDGGTPAPVARD